MRKLLSTTALVFTLAISGVAYANDDWHGKGDHKGPPPYIEEALSKLPEEDAAQFRNTMKQSQEKGKTIFEQMHKLHEDLHGILTAEKFDKAAYIAKNKELTKLHDKMHANMTEAFATAAAQLSQDDRKILADAMKNKWHHHHDEAQKSDGDKPSSDNDQQ